MSFKQQLNQEAAFDINLAPVLDIIVSIVPMLLLSVAFLQVKMIETPVPQVVAQASEQAQKDDQIEVTITASKTQGFAFEVKEKGQARTLKVEMPVGQINLDAIYGKALEIKKQYPQVLNVSLNPAGDLSLAELVNVMDAIRKMKPQDGSVAFRDPATSQPIKTDFLFPKVIFGNIAGE